LNEVETIADTTAKIKNVKTTPSTPQEELVVPLRVSLIEGCH
jgi:hypothetical protein